MEVVKTSVLTHRAVSIVLAEKAFNCGQMGQPANVRAIDIDLYTSDRSKSFIFSFSWLFIYFEFGGKKNNSSMF